VTGAEILRAFESIGARVVLTPAGIVDVDAPEVPELERLIAEVKANRSEVVEELKRHAAPARPCLACSQAADELTLYCPSCWEKRHARGRVLAFDATRRARTLVALAERFCATCGFSFWRVSPRGDADCYGCDLIREGKPLRCAACGGEEWRRDEHGRCVCSTCHGGDARVAAPPVQTRPEPTSREVSEEGGAS
jgi:hypothetical protein